MKKHMNVEFLESLDISGFVDFIETLTLDELFEMPVLPIRPLANCYDSISDYIEIYKVNESEVLNDWRRKDSKD